MKRLLLVIGLCSSLFGCSGATMYVDPLLAERAAPMPVAQSSVAWKKWVSFGPYRANVTSGVPWHWSVGVLGGDLELGWQSHAARISEGAEAVQAACRTRKVSFGRGGWSIDPAFGRQPLVRCAIKAEEEPQSWLMTLRRTGIGDYAGSLSRGGEVIEIASEHRVAGKALTMTEPFGYALTRAGTTVAAVRSGTARRVWIDPALDKPARLRAAAAAAALLLFDPSEDAN